jgi:ABC-2 type transport system permease protein
MNTSGFIRRFSALLRKEVRQMLRDRSTLAVGLMLPAVLILLFGYGLSFDVKNAPVAVVLEDSSPSAREVLAGLEGSPYLAPVWTTSMTEAERRMRDGEVRAIVRVPADFSRRLGSGASPGAVAAERCRFQHGRCR